MCGALHGDCGRGEAAARTPAGGGAILGTARRPTTHALLSSIASAALGIAPEVELRWQAPGDCPSAEIVRDRVRTLTTGSETDLVARVTVTAESDGYVAAIELEHGGITATRELRGATCDVLTDAVAVVVAIESDAPTPRVPTPEPVPEDPVEAPPEGDPGPISTPPKAAPVAPPVRPRAAVPSSPMRVAIRAGGGVEGRGAPGTSGVATIGAGLRWRRWHLDLGLLHAFARTRRLPAPDRGVGAHVAVWSAELGGAFVPAVGIVGFPLSLRLELGDAVASAFGNPTARRQHALWLAARAGVGLQVVVARRVALWLDPSVGLALVRPRFAVRTPDGDQTLAQAARVGFRVVAGVEVRFR